MHQESYCDSYWTSYLDDKKSILGFCVFVGCNLVSWKSKKHPIVVRSIVEENRVVALGVA